MRPIQTQYKGYFFRSRLEARWAIFFDALGIKWEYELEGFHLSNGEMYLPDFFLPKFCGPQGMYVEVKPEPGIDPKARQLVMDSGVPLLMACGAPGPMSYVVLEDEPTDETSRACFDAKYLPGGSNEEEYRLFWNPGYEEEDGSIDERFIDRSVLAAIVRARSARFEHGQVGAML